MAELGFALSTSAFEKDFRSVTIDLSPQLPLLSLKKKSETSGQHQELSIQICGAWRHCQSRELETRANGKHTQSPLSSPDTTSSVSQLPVGWLTVIQMPKIAIQRLVSAGWVSSVNSSRKKKGHWGSYQQIVFILFLVILLWFLLPYSGRHKIGEGDFS